MAKKRLIHSLDKHKAETAAKREAEKQLREAYSKRWRESVDGGGSSFKTVSMEQTQTKQLAIKLCKEAIDLRKHGQIVIVLVSQHSITLNSCRCMIGGNPIRFYLSDRGHIADVLDALTRGANVVTIEQETASPLCLYDDTDFLPPQAP